MAAFKHLPPPPRQKKNCTEVGYNTFSILVLKWFNPKLGSPYDSWKEKGGKWVRTGRQVRRLIKDVREDERRRARKNERLKEKMTVR